MSIPLEPTPDRGLVDVAVPVSVECFSEEGIVVPLDDRPLE